MRIDYYFTHLTYPLLLIVVLGILISFTSESLAQLSPSSSIPPLTSIEELVTYDKESNFIKEFEIPIIEELGLKGITIDSQGYPWFYHSTNKTSTIMKLQPESKKITPYTIEGATKVDNAIINLAGGQLLYDDERSIIWFTDARTNSIGKLDITNGSVELIDIPTPKSGVMGIVMSPDKKNIWFTEIIANKIASLDIKSNQISEYATGNQTGPTLLTFDSKGVLWVTMSYSNNVLRVEPWALIPGRSGPSSIGMQTITLQKPDIFSPFGITIINVKDNIQKMFVADHSSSRVVSSYVYSENLNNYSSYWTSPSPQKYLTTLPSQIVADKVGKNVYFPQHGGNRISKIDVRSGIMTEYDIPTGPVSSAVFIAISDDGTKVWFTEWASNKVAYLDTTVQIPLNLQVKSNNTVPLTLKINQPKTLDVKLSVNKNNSNIISSSTSPLSLTEVELAIIGMTDSGLSGITYDARPQRINMENNFTSQINLKAQQTNINPSSSGQYTIMTKASAPEKDQLFVSLLYPVPVKLDLPVMKLQQQQQQEDNKQLSEGKGGFIQDLSVRDIVRNAALLAAIGLIAYIVYRRIKRSKSKKEQ